MHARRVFPHGEIDPRGEFLPVGPHIHFPIEGVDVDGKGLQRDLVDTGRQLHGGQRQQKNQKVLFHTHKGNTFF